MWFLYDCEEISETEFRIVSTELADPEIYVRGMASAVKADRLNGLDSTIQQISPDLWKARFPIAETYIHVYFLVKAP